MHQYLEHFLQSLVCYCLQWLDPVCIIRGCGAQLRAVDDAQGIQTAAVFLLAEILLSALSQENEKAPLHPVCHQLGGMSDQYAAHDPVCLAGARVMGANGIYCHIFH